MTNADKLRQMTNEELASFIRRLSVDSVFFACGMSKESCPLAFNNEAEAYDWLLKDEEAAI